jgi:hypothetical protein
MRAATVASAAAAAALAVGLGGAWADRASTAKLPPPPPPMPPPSRFVDQIDNPYMPLQPGTTLIYHGTTNQGREVDRVTTTHDTKKILGVEARVILDYATLNGRPEEKTFDWFAQDKVGNVWYLGEKSFDWRDGKWVENDGSWQAGIDGAKAGIAMEAHPKEGDVYRQEYYKGHAEDVARILETRASVSVPYGHFEHVVVTRDWTPLEPDVVEHKYFAPGVGEAKSVMVRGGTEVSVLVEVRHE